MLSKTPENWSKTFQNWLKAALSAQIDCSGENGLILSMTPENTSKTFQNLL